MFSGEICHILVQRLLLSLLCLWACMHPYCRTYIHRRCAHACMHARKHRSVHVRIPHACAPLDLAGVGISDASLALAAFTVTDRH